MDFDVEKREGAEGIRAFSQALLQEQQTGKGNCCHVLQAYCAHRFKHYRLDIRLAFLFFYKEAVHGSSLKIADLDLGVSMDQLGLGLGFATRTI